MLPWDDDNIYIYRHTTVIQTNIRHCLTDGVRRQFPRQMRAPGAEGASGDVGAADASGAADTAGNDAGATDGGTAESDVAVIPAGDRKASGRRGSPGQ